jgi:glycosyltransferase involved in cell wall biosynthesis
MIEGQSGNSGESAMPVARIFVREVIGGVATMMARWMEAARGRVQASVVLARDTSRSFAPLDPIFGPGLYRVCFDGRLDNRMKVYRQLIAAVESPRDHLVANDNLELGMIAALRPRNPVTFFLHGDYDYYYDLAVQHAGRIGSFGCVSSAILKKLRQLLPARQDDIYLTYPIISDPVGGRLKRNSGSPIRLLFVGRLTEDKGFFDLPAIDQMLSQSNVPASWTVVGEAPVPLREEYARWLAKPGVTHIRSLKIDQMNDVYQANDVLVFPSRAEGFGMCVAEAMKCGTVPIASRLDAGIPEMIKDGATGFTVEKGDRAGFARQIAALFERPDILDQVSADASVFARAKFDIDTSVAAMSRAILSASALNGPSGPTYLSRMDTPFLPNFFVRTSRSLLHKLQRA